MKPSIVLLHAAALAAAVASPARAAPSAAACAAPRQIVERFVPAECETCWRAEGEPAPDASSWALDWIVPGASPESPLAAGALPEAAERLTALGYAPDPSATRTVQHRLSAAPGVRLQTKGGPAWNGYLGLELRSQGRPPAGAVAWLALVEVLPAGAEGSTPARRLVRAVAGPLSLDPHVRPGTHLRAMRIPEGAKAERLEGVAWWTDARGAVRGMAREGCPPAARPG